MRGVEKGRGGRGEERKWRGGEGRKKRKVGASVTRSTSVHFSLSAVNRL